MRHFLTSFLAFHWASVFAALAIACVVGGDGGVMSAFRLLDISIPQDGLALAGRLPEAGFAVAFAVVSVLFFWGFVTALFGRGATRDDCDDIFRLAFGAAAGVLSVTLLAGVLLGAPRPLSAIAAHFAALVASYAAIHIERWVAYKSIVAAMNDNTGTISRLMALGAAHSSLLSRLSGRSNPHWGKGV
jgi:hypothetical protein